jgi:hypothetical protein
MVKKPDLRLNQLLDRFLRSVFGLEEGGSMVDGVAEVKLDDSLCPTSWYDEPGRKLKEVRELLNDWRRLVMLKMRRTPDGLRMPGELACIGIW